MSSAKHVTNDQLLRIVIEQLKLPFLHIARETELAGVGGVIDYKNINSVASMAMKMIDSYLMTAEYTNQQILPLEPVSISSVLNTVANNLSDMAKIYNCEIELNLGGKFAPVMSERTKLESAFTMLGYSYIEANLSNNPDAKSGRIILTGYKTAGGLTAGVFSPAMTLSSANFKRAINSLGNVRQTLPEISQTTAVGIFLADSIFDSLATKLRVAHYRKLSGLAATLIPSHQLELVI